MDELVVLFFGLDGYRRLAQFDSIPPAKDLNSPNGSKITVSLAASSEFDMQQDYCFIGSQLSA